MYEFCPRDVRHQVQDELRSSGHDAILKECRRYDRTVADLVPLVTALASAKAVTGIDPRTALWQAVGEVCREKA